MSLSATKPANAQSSPAAETPAQPTAAAPSGSNRPDGVYFLAAELLSVTETGDTALPDLDVYCIQVRPKAASVNQKDGMSDDHKHLYSAKRAVESLLTGVTVAVRYSDVSLVAVINQDQADTLRNASTMSNHGWSLQVSQSAAKVSPMR